VGIVVGKLALGKVFLQALLFPLPIIIPSSGLVQQAAADRRAWQQEF
jgi:hypothetical protein